MKKDLYRHPKNYNGTHLTSRSIGDLLLKEVARISAVYSDRSDLVLAAWPSIIGPKLAPMTQAVSVCDGVLTVKVKNSTLLSLLSRNDKYRILSAIKQQFPKAGIVNISFKIA